MSKPRRASMETTLPTPAESEFVGPLWTSACTDIVGIVEKGGALPGATNPPSCYQVNFKLTFDGWLSLNITQSTVESIAVVAPNNKTVQCHDTVAAGCGNRRTRMAGH